MLPGLVNILFSVLFAWLPAPYESVANHPNGLKQAPIERAHLQLYLGELDRRHQQQGRSIQNETRLLDAELNRNARRSATIDSASLPRWRTATPVGIKAKGQQILALLPAGKLKTAPVDAVHAAAYPRRAVLIASAHRTGTESFARLDYYSYRKGYVRRGTDHIESCHPFALPVVFRAFAHCTFGAASRTPLTFRTSYHSIPEIIHVPFPA